MSRLKNLIFSLLFGLVVGILFILVLLPFSRFFVGFALGFSIFALAALLIGAFIGAAKCNCILSLCLKLSAPPLIFSVIGLLLTSSVAIGMGLIPINIFAIILVALTAFFLALTFLNLIELIQCIIRNLSKNVENN